MAYQSDDLMRLVQGVHTDQVRALEDATVAQAVGDLDAQFDTLAGSTLAAWVAAFGGAGVTAEAGSALDRIVGAVRSAIHRLLDQIGPRSRNALRTALPQALALGLSQGAEFVRAATGRARAVPKLRIPTAIADEAARVADLVADRRNRAVALLGRGQVRRWSDLLHAVGMARSAGSAVRGHAAWVLGQAVNAGLDATAQTAKLARLWVAEANACVRCLAYTGRIVAAGHPFPGGLSWDPQVRTIGAPAIDGPPLHAHCRCRTVAWSARWKPDGVPFPAALQREAHRSIAYGRALPSESRVSRVRAARELLRTEPDLLPAVESTARTAVRTGRFPAAA
jgi:hypothetical protein